MGLRKYERAIVKHRCIQKDGNAKNFPFEWKKYHDNKVKARIKQEEKDGKLTVVRAKPTIQKKHRHYDDGRVMLRHMRMMKNWIDQLKASKKEKQIEA